MRQDREWSANQLFKFVREELKLGPDSRSTFVAELHHDPKPHWIPGLIKLFEEPPAVPEPPKIVQPPDLASAIVALTEELQEARKERAATEARLVYLEATVEILAHVAGVTLPVPPTLGGTAG